MILVICIVNIDWPTRGIRAIDEVPVGTSARSGSLFAELAVLAWLGRAHLATETAELLRARAVRQEAARTSAGITENLLGAAATDAGWVI